MIPVRENSEVVIVYTAEHAEEHHPIAMAIREKSWDDWLQPITENGEQPTHLPTSSTVE